MSVFEHRSFDGHERVAFRADRETGLRAIIAIHNTHLGYALGGCRMHNYSSSEAALDDVLRLSRGMTYKSALAGLPLGGGKSVIIGDPQRDKSPQLLRAMGRFIDSFHGDYVAAEDAGMGERDVQVMASVTPHVAGVSGRGRNNGDPSPATVCGVMAGIRLAVQQQFGGSDLRDLRVAVQGLGNVGYELARQLRDEGAHLWVADVIPARVERARAELAATAVAADEIFCAPVDLVAPCALGAVIDDVVLNQLQARLIAGSANNQLAYDDLGSALKARGILYVPDYAINAGGIIDVWLQGQGVARDEAYRQIRQRVEETVGLILSRARASGLPTNQVADELARQRFAPDPHPVDHAA